LCLSSPIARGRSGTLASLPSGPALLVAKFKNQSFWLSWRISPRSASTSARRSLACGRPPFARMKPLTVYLRGQTRAHRPCGAPRVWPVRNFAPSFVCDPIRDRPHSERTLLCEKDEDPAAFAGADSRSPGAGSEQRGAFRHRADERDGGTARCCRGQACVRPEGAPDKGEYV
jgi:hypothetical protein